MGLCEHYARNSRDATGQLLSHLNVLRLWPQLHPKLNKGNQIYRVIIEFLYLGEQITDIPELCQSMDQQLKLLHQYNIYPKNSKIWDTSNNCHNCPKNRKVWCNIALMHPKDADGVANSVDPDQTASSEAVWSWSALFAETYLSQYIEFVRYPAIKRGFPYLERPQISISALWNSAIL